MKGTGPGADASDRVRAERRCGDEVTLDEGSPGARIRMSQEDREHNERLLARLMSGQPLQRHQLDEPSRIGRRLFDLGFDNEVNLLWGDDADASRAYRKLLHASQSQSMRSLELATSAAGAIGALTRGGSPIGTACLIAPNVILASASVLASSDAARGVNYVYGGRGAPERGVDPAAFFYASGELGFTVCALSANSLLEPSATLSAEPTAPLRIADRANAVVGERVTVAHAQATDNVLLSTAILVLRMGRFFHLDLGDEKPPGPERNPTPTTLSIRGAPVFDVTWRLAGVVRDAADGVAEMIDMAGIQRELQHVSEHYGKPASQVVDSVLNLTAVTARSAESEPPSRSAELIVPLKIRLSIAAETAGPRPDASQPTRPPTRGDVIPAAGVLPELSSAGIDLDATDGPDSVPAWTNEGALGPAGAEHFARATEQFGGDWDQSRLWYWSTRLLLEAQRRRRLKSIPALAYLAAGFLDPHRERTGLSHFGLIAYTRDSAQLSSRAISLPPLEIDGWKFPVVIRPVQIQPQQPTTMPRDGWASCWARTRVETGDPIGPGVLTAKHVVEGYSIGQQIPLDDGKMGEVLDLAPRAVDAALVRTSQDPPPGANTLPMTEYIAPLVPVTLQLRDRNLSSRVVDVNNTFKFFKSADLPLRVGLEHAGLPGDSGGLVTTDEGVAIGLYVGRLVNELDQRLGLAQHISQAGAVMKGMELLC